MLAEVVPGTRVKRSLIGRHVTAIHLPVGGYVYVLKRGAGGTFEANRSQQVRGVVIKTDPMEIEAFLAELGLALDVELERTEKGRDALRRWLNGRNPD
jgi:hypothetical protein